MPTLLQKYVDAEQWEAEDVVGRLGIILHAAFLIAGFVPYYGAQPQSGYLLKKPAGESSKGSVCLSRWYTAPQLAHREDADAAVLLLSAKGSHVALLVYLITTNEYSVRRSMYRERLDVAALTPLLSRAMDSTEPWGSRICRSLSNAVCWRFLGELCRGNGLRPPTTITSLPDDVKVEILKRLADSADLAKVQCVSRQLKSLVADRDGELWKPLCEQSIVRLIKKLPVDINREMWEPMCKWLAGRLLEIHPSARNIMLSTGFLFLPFFPLRDEYRSAELKTLSALTNRPRLTLTLRTMDSPAPPTSLSDDLETETVVAEGRSAGCQHHRKVPRNKKKKRPQSDGAIRLPRSRYRWNHR
ncbi:hypothetical protein QOZ80_1AG0034520 [Eleusine coracana subsp. coracana]|nr:hypothetical protein QOZ80_1AG0034520 [Eleusine coracana subsp. coracana]